MRTKQFFSSITGPLTRNTAKKTRRGLPPHLSKLRTDERGSVLILVTISLLVLLGAAAMVMDGGVLLVDRRLGQNAADAAALAGAQVILEGGSASQARAEAGAYVIRNGLDLTGDAYQVDTPPLHGSQAGNQNAIEVTVSRSQPASFARVFGVGQLTSQARAVGLVTYSPRNYGIIALNKTACKAIDLNGNIRITISGGGTFDESGCGDSAFSANGNVTVQTSVNDVVGGWDLNGSVSISPPPSKSSTIVDPLATLPTPTPPSGPTRSCPNLNGSGSYTFQPGVYNCSINPNGNWDITFSPGDYLITGGINFNGNLTANFGAGIYTLRGLGLVVNGNSRVTASGVMFYIDSGRIDLNGTTAMTLTAPTTGVFKGIVFFQKRTITFPVNLNGNSIANGWGTTYAAGATVDFNGNASSRFQFISDKFLNNGNTDVSITFAGVPVLTPSARLVE